MSTIQIRKDTSDNWAAANPTLALGELGLDTTHNQIKAGDGVTAWDSLPYLKGDTGNITFSGGELNNSTGGDIAITPSEGNTALILPGDTNSNAGEPTFLQNTGSGGIVLSTGQGNLNIGNADGPTQPTHLHIRQDNPANVNLFLGDDNQFVKLATDGTTVVQARIGSEAQAIVSGAPIGITYSTQITYITRATPAVVTVADTSGLSAGVTVYLHEITQTDWISLRDTSYYVGSVIDGTTFNLYTDSGLTTPLNTTAINSEWGGGDPQADGNAVLLSNPGEAYIIAGFDSTNITNGWGNSYIGGGNVTIETTNGLFTFDSTGALNLEAYGVIRNGGEGSVNIVGSNFAQLQWTVDGINTPNPNYDSNVYNWLYVDEYGTHIGGSTNYGWDFNTNGVLNAPALGEVIATHEFNITARDYQHEGTTFVNVLNPAEVQNPADNQPFYIKGVQYLNNGDIVVIGESYGFNTAFVKRIHSSNTSGYAGNTVWSYQLSGSPYGYGLTTDASNNVYITLQSNNDSYVLKLDSNGNKVWETKIHGTSKTVNGFNLDYNQNGSISLVGVINSGGNDQSFIAQLDCVTGAVNWEKSISGAGYEDSFGIGCDSAGNTLIVGNTQDSNPTKVFLALFDINGTLTWQKYWGNGININSALQGADVCIDSSGNWYVYTTWNNESISVGVTKIDSSGTIIWSKGLQGTCEDWAASIAVDSSDNLYIYGTMTNLNGMFDQQTFIGVMSPAGSLLHQHYFGKRGNFNFPGEAPWGDNPYSNQAGQMISVNGTNIVVAGMVSTVGFGDNATDPTESITGWVAQVPALSNDSYKIGEFEFLVSNFSFSDVAITPGSGALTIDNAGLTVTISGSVFTLQPTNITFTTYRLGDMTWTFRQDGTLNMPFGSIGYMELGTNGLDLYSDIASWVGLNYNNTNWVRVTSDGAFVNTSGEYQWSFNDDGSTSLPGSLHISPNSGNPIIAANNNNSLTVGADLDVTVSSASGGKQWVFDRNGKLTLPANSSNDSVIYSEAGNIELYTNRESGSTKIRNKATLDQTWTFSDAGLTFPDTTTQTTAYTGQVGAGNSGWALLYGGNKLGSGGEHDWVDFDGSVVDGQGYVYFFGGTIAFSQGSGVYNPIITKVNSDGGVEWSTVIHDYYGKAVAAFYIESSGGNYVLLYTDDETDTTTTKQWTYGVNPADGSLSEQSYTIPSQSGVGVCLRDGWAYTLAGSGTLAIGWAGFTTNEIATTTLTILTDPAPDSTSFSVLKTNVPGLTLYNYSVCFIDTMNTISGIDDNSTYWTIHVGTPADFTTGSHTIQIPQNSNATIGVVYTGGGAWLSVGTAGNTYEYYSSTAVDKTNGTIYAVGNDDNGHSIVSSFSISSGLVANWHKRINLSTSYLQLTGVDVDIGGSAIYVVGDGDNGCGYITKMDSTGHIIWQRKIDDSGQPFGVSELSVAVGTGNEIIVACGSYGSDFTQNNAVLIVRFNSNGDTVWQRQLDTSWSDYAGAGWDSYGTGTPRFVSADGISYYLSLAINGSGPQTDGGGVKLPLNGEGTGSWGSGDGTWNYTNVSWPITSIDVTADSTSITDFVVSTLSTTSGSGSTPSVYTGIKPANTTIIGSDAIKGIDRAAVSHGNDTITLDITHNGKFIYYYTNTSAGYPTIIVPNNNSVQLPIGYTVTMAVDTFSYNGSHYVVNINTNGDTSNGLIINASGIIADSYTGNYWGIAGDGKPGIYTLMKVDTNRWILSGPNVFIND